MVVFRIVLSLTKQVRGRLDSYLQKIQNLTLLEPGADTQYSEFGNPAILAPSAEDPWLCVPTSRWVCLFVNLIYSMKCTMKIGLE